MAPTESLLRGFFKPTFCNKMLSLSLNNFIKKLLLTSIVNRLTVEEFGQANLLKIVLIVSICRNFCVANLLFNSYEKNLLRTSSSKSFFAYVYRSSAKIFKEISHTLAFTLGLSKQD